MTPDQKNLLGLAAAGALIYFLMKKKNKGSLIIGEPYDGQFLDDEGNDITIRDTDGTQQGNDVITTPSWYSERYINYVGPFEVSYDKPTGTGLVSGIC